MPAWVARTGAGTILTGDISTGFTPKVLNYNGFEYGVPDFDCTSMSSAVGTVYTDIIGREFLAGDIAEPVEITVDIFVDLAQVEGIPLKVANTWTWQFLPIGTETTGATLVWDGFIKKWSFDVQLEDIVKGSIMMRMTGEPNFTAGISPT